MLYPLGVSVRPRVCWGKKDRERNPIWRDHISCLLGKSHQSMPHGSAQEAESSLHWGILIVIFIKITPWSWELPSESWGSSESLFLHASWCIKQLLSLQEKEVCAGAAAPLRQFCAPRQAWEGKRPVGEMGASLAPTWQQQNIHPFFCKVQLKTVLQPYKTKEGGKRP